MTLELPTVDLGHLATLAAGLAPTLALMARESGAWRAELAAWRRELGGARIVIEPAHPPVTDPPTATLDTARPVDDVCAEPMYLRPPPGRLETSVPR